MEEEKSFKDEIKELVENKIKEFKATDINANNLDVLYKLIDIHKDIENEEYWEIKKEVYENEIQRI